MREKGPRRFPARRRKAGIAGFGCDRLALGVQKNVGRRVARAASRNRSRRIFFLAEINQHEAAAAEISRLRQSHRQGEAHGDRCVNRIAAAPQDIDPDLRRRSLLGDDHSMVASAGKKRAPCDGSALSADRRAKRSEENASATAQKDVRHARNAIVRIGPGVISVFWLTSRSTSRLRGAEASPHFSSRLSISQDRVKPIGIGARSINFS